MASSVRATSAVPGKVTTKTDFDKACKAVFHAGDAINTPMDKLIESYVTRVGAPSKTEGGKRIWSVTEGDDCYKVELADDGMFSTEKIFDEKLKAETCKK